MSDQESKTVTVPQGLDTRPPTGDHGRRVDTSPTGLPRRPQPEGAEPEPGRRRRTRLVWLAVTAAVIAVIALVVAVTATSEQGANTSEQGATPEGNVATMAEPPVGSQEYLARLANQGYIPKEAVNQDLLRRERLENRGDIPTRSFESGGNDRLLDDLVNQGRIPQGAR